MRPREGSFGWWGKVRRDEHRTWGKDVCGIPEGLNKICGENRGEGGHDSTCSAK